ncbi:MAG: zf-HC2 domain-containing protein [candidate division WOR-3 bacterium]
MRHEEIERLIHKRLDKEITTEEEKELFEHIRRCSQCREFYLEMERIKQDIFNLTEFFPRVDFNTRIISAIKVRRHIPWYKAIPAFGGIYLIGLTILLFTPLPNYLFSKLILTLPWIIRIFDKIKPFSSGLFLLASSFLKSNQVLIFSGFLLSLVIFYTIGKTLKTREVL